MVSGITFDGVVKRYGSKTALAGVALTTGSGIVGLLGPNGAGKTTLLRIAATVLAPTDGRVDLLGLDPADTESRVEIRRRLGYLPQDPGFHLNFTAFDFVDYVAILKGMTDRRHRHDEVRRVLDAVNLKAEMHRKIKSLSGGMRRRVGFAQALLGSPDLLVLDEPTAGLDPEQRLRFRELVSDTAGRTVLLSTHQTEDVAALCSRVVVLLEGGIAFDGTPAGLAGLALDRVWLDDRRHPDALLSWQTGTGECRNIGDPPDAATIVAPTIEDGYLLLLGPRGAEQAA